MAAQTKTYDFLIKNALVYDGVSWRPVQEDVAIDKDRIAAVGNLEGADGHNVIDADGLALAPGFIDAHTHSDFNPLVYPKLPNKILQGVTTEIVGNCGMSAAPVLGLHRERIAGIWAREGVVIPKDLPWRTFAEYKKTLEEKGMMTHFGALVGHGNLRSAVMGFNPRKASPNELKQMKKYLEAAMKQGALGISYGLVYLPGLFADEDELVELCRVAAKYSGVCAFHMRNEGAQLKEALEEALRIGEKAQARIQISHLKAAGRKNWDKIGEAFSLIEAARARGVDVLADAYPYNASQAELGVILPDELYQREDRVEFFRKKANREALIKQLHDYFEERNMQWDTVMIASTPGKKFMKYEGKTIKQIARDKNKSAETVLIELLADTAFEISAFSFSQKQEVVNEVFSKPYVSLGSDSVADGARKTHPRAYGSSAKVFRYYVREQKKLRLGEAVSKMTSVPAKHFGLTGRGEIKAGNYADLVIFDPERFTDRATYENPDQLAEGVRWVFVGGVPEVINGRAGSDRNGRFLAPGK